MRNIKLSVFSCFLGGLILSSSTISCPIWLFSSKPKASVKTFTKVSSSPGTAEFILVTLSVVFFGCAFYLIKQFVKSESESYRQKQLRIKRESEELKALIVLMGFCNANSAKQMHRLDEIEKKLEKIKMCINKKYANSKPGLPASKQKKAV